jgi:hypothetical protein
LHSFSGPIRREDIVDDLSILVGHNHLAMLALVLAKHVNTCWHDAAIKLGVNQPHRPSQVLGLPTISSLGKIATGASSA